MKIESRPAVNLFLQHFYFRGNIALYAVSCLLWCLPELSNDNTNQAQQVMRCYTMIVLTHWPILTLLHSFWYEGMYHIIFIYLTTTSGRPEPECTLRRVMSSEPVQYEQSTRDCKQTTNN